MSTASERINLRTTPEAKSIIEQAASITGLTVNAFMVQFAYEKAQALIQDHQNLRLSRADHDMLPEMLENPRPANQALKDMMSLLDED